MSNDVPVPIKLEKKVLEKHIVQYLIKQVKKVNGKCLAWSSMNVRFVHDRICIFPSTPYHPLGLICLVEVKRNIACKLAPGQARFHAELREMGIEHSYVVKSKEEVLSFIKRIGY